MGAGGSADLTGLTGLTGWTRLVGSVSAGMTVSGRRAGRWAAQWIRLGEARVELERHELHTLLGYVVRGSLRGRSSRLDTGAERNAVSDGGGKPYHVARDDQHGNRPGPGSPNRLLYSRIEVGVPPPPPPDLPAITGPTWVRPGSNCLWQVSSGDAVLPVTYAWFVDMVTQSELSGSFQYAAGSADFELQAALTDAYTVAWWSSPYPVTVSVEAPECLDQ